MKRKRRIRRWANRWEPSRPGRPPTVEEMAAAVRGIGRTMNAFVVSLGWTPESVRRTRAEFRPLLLQREAERMAIARGARAR